MGIVSRDDKMGTINTRNKKRYPVKRKVEKSVEITVNVGDMQFIKIRNMVGEEFEYDTDEQRITKEHEIWQQVSEDVRFALVDSLRILKKKTEAPEKFADACGKKLEPKS